MPNGNTHTAATIALAVGLGSVAYYNGYPAVPLTAGILAGLVLTPDLDVAGGSISNYHMQRAGGCLVGAVWSLIWAPYSRLLHHRSIWSHLPILSTAIRLGYLAIIPAVLIYLRIVPMPSLPGWWIWPVMGLALSDCLHYLMDKTMRN